MDADSRHQLKQNELVEFLSQFRHPDRNTLATIGVVLAVVLGYVGWRAWGYFSLTSREHAWEHVAQITGDPNNISVQAQLREAAAQAGPAGDLARIRLATALLTQAADDGDLAASGKAGAEVAKLMQPMVDRPDVPTALAGSATMLLAQALEAQRDLDGARKYYQALVSNGSRFAGYPVQDAARVQLTSLDTLKREVVFLPGAAPQPRPGPEAMGPPAPGSIPPGLGGMQGLPPGMIMPPGAEGPGMPPGMMPPGVEGPGMPPGMLPPGFPDEQ